MNNTIGKSFFEDEKTKKMIADLVAHHQESAQKINAIKKPNDNLKAPFLKLVEEYSELRGGKLYFPYLSSGMGNKAFIELEDGSVKYDFIIGIGVHIFGHSHPLVLKACLEAGLEDTVMLGNLQQNVKSYEFTKQLLTAANKNGAKMAHCFLSSSGVIAGENTMKIMFQNRFPADRVLAFKGTFMGRTLAFSQYTDKAANRVGLPVNYKIDYIPFFEESDPQGSTERAVSALREVLHRYPNQFAAMSFELILGEGGFYKAKRDFYVALMEELKSHDVPIIIDEVQTFSRSSELFAYQHFNLDEYVDAVWIGKASQVCATLYKKEFKPKPGLLSQTYTSSNSAIASGYSIIKSLIEDGYLGADGKNMQIHSRFVKNFEDIKSRHENLIRGPYGEGTMIGFTPLDGEKEKVVKFVHKLFENGVMSFMAGQNPTRARMLVPQGAVTMNDIDNVSQIIEDTLKEM